MIVGNYKNLILTIKLVKTVLGAIQGDQPEMADSRRGIVRAICRLGDFFCIAISQHRSRYGLHLPVSASQVSFNHLYSGQAVILRYTQGPTFALPDACRHQKRL